MANHTWRDEAAPIIYKVLQETKGKSDKEIRAALKVAYPFGERRYHPYKVWLSEIAKQRKNKRTVAVVKEQLELFNQ